MLSRVEAPHFPVGLNSPDIDQLALPVSKEGQETQDVRTKR